MIFKILNTISHGLPLTYRKEQMLANGLRIQRLLMGQHFLMVDFGEVLIKEQV